MSSVPFFKIEVDESNNPVAPGNTLTYTITYSNITAVNATNTSLRFPLPSGVSFVTASNGGNLNENIIEWDLQVFPAQRGGRQTVTVTVNEDVVPGSLLEVDAAEITGQINGVDAFAHAQVVTRIANNIPFSFAVNINSNPMTVTSSEQHALTLTVENISDENIFDGVLRVEMPSELKNFTSDVATALCAPVSEYCFSVNRSSYYYLWLLGNMQPGDVFSVNTQFDLPYNLENGSLLHFKAVVDDDTGQQVELSRTVLASDQDFVQNVLTPDLTGLSQSAAAEVISNAGLSVGAISTASSATVPAGQVISQNPNAGIRVAFGTAVNLFISTGSGNLDSDSDSIPDSWEVLYGFDPFNAADASLDLDGDGLTNLEEYQADTFPNNSDSDNDGILDGWDSTPLNGNTNVCTGNNATLGIISKSIRLTDFSAQSGSRFRAANQEAGQ